MEPERGLQVAQPAGALLDVRFEELDGTPEAAVTGSDVVEDPADEPRGRLHGDMRPESVVELSGERLIAADRRLSSIDVHESNVVP